MVGNDASSSPAEFYRGGEGGTTRPLVRQATKSTTKITSTRAMVSHSSGRSGGQWALGAALDDDQDEKRPAEGHEGHGSQQGIGPSEERRRAFHLALAAARACWRSWQDTSCRCLAAAISARIDSAAEAAGICLAAASVRHLSSIVPSLSPRSPITTRSGMPIKSASLNFTPGR